MISDKRLRVRYRALPTLHGGSLEITPTVPLNKKVRSLPFSLKLTLSSQKIEKREDSPFKNTFSSWKLKNK